MTQLGVLLNLPFGATANIELISGRGEEGMRLFFNDTEIEPRVDMAFHLTTNKWVPLTEYKESLKSIQPSSSLYGGASAPVQLEDGVDELNTDIDSVLERLSEENNSTSTGKVHHRGISSSRFWIYHPSQYEFILTTRDLSIRVVNSDGFFNIDTNLLRRNLFIQSLGDAESDGDSTVKPMSGIIGQTVVLKKYSNQWRYLKGDIDEYAVSSLLEHDDKVSLLRERV
jgi:hypothetical protein